MPSGSFTPTEEDVAPVLSSAFPYDRVRMTREVAVVGRDGKERKGERPVARTIDEAQNLHLDYWHPGGEIRDSSGRIIGTRQRGWLRSGYKWEDDLPQNISEIYLS
jgi:hypothetical protein